jgi:hypothetical protein
MLPRLLIPSSFVLPPVEYYRGTSPSHAAKSRPFRNADPLPIAVTMAVATIGPMSDLSNATAARVAGSDLFKLVCQRFDLLFDGLPLISQHADQAAHHRGQRVLCVLKNICHGCLELRWLLRKDHATLEQKRSYLVDNRCAPEAYNLLPGRGYKRRTISRQKRVFVTDQFPTFARAAMTRLVPAYPLGNYGFFTNAVPFPREQQR